MSDEISYPLTIKFGDQGKETFKSADEVEDFFKREHAAWQFLEDVTVPRPHQMNLKRVKLSSVYTGLGNALSQLRSLQYGNLQTSSVNNIEEIYNQNILIKSTSPKGVFLTSIVDKNNPISLEIAAGAFLAMSNNYTTPQNDIFFTASMVQGSLLSLGLKHKTPDLSVVNSAYQGVLEKISKNQGELSRFIEEKEIQYNNFKAERENFVAEKTSQYENVLQILEEKFTRLENTYIEQMGLQAPSQYWSNEQNKHKGSHRIWLGISVFYFSSVLIFLYCMINFELPKFISEWSEKKEQFASVQYIYIFASITVMTVLFWIGRLLTRLMMSERHLATDAAERSVMAKTYLALAHEKGAAETERHIVLASLFRNSSDGIVKEDNTADAGLASMLAKLLTKP